MPVWRVLTRDTYQQWLEQNADNVGDCWIFRGVKARGYGRRKIRGRRIAIHRWVYEQLVGPIPAGRELDHTCNRPACVWLDHLDPVTHGVNQTRAVRRRVTRLSFRHHAETADGLSGKPAE